MFSAVTGFMFLWTTMGFYAAKSCSKNITPGSNVIGLGIVGVACIGMFCLGNTKTWQADPHAILYLNQVSHRNVNSKPTPSLLLCSSEIRLVGLRYQFILNSVKLALHLTAT